MPRPHIRAAVAALALGVYSTSFAYSGDLGSGGPALPVMMQFDDAHADIATQDVGMRKDDNRQTPGIPARHLSSKAVHDDFQRYFDRHYRAHLVLDAAAHRFFEAE